MRNEIAVVAGPKEWGDTRGSWLARVPGAVRRALGTKRETVSHRAVRGLWYGEITDLDHHAARDVRRAAEIIKARKEAAKLATTFQTVAEKMRAAHHTDFSSDIARLERVARLLGGGDRA
ncbi:hypothetical protein CQ13_07575 [Bradyrhizobium retamae]|uniref:Uncharacterized protein n=1 Tax=Bradyrhizobium retamae TaxID=1300035 RepID=A0A0R3MQN4_9BRAD|nr:hypothetical protein CQ13_07575 [Bradyrhizobium retamae]